LEADGRAGRTRLSAFRPIAQAQQVDFQGNTQLELSIEQGAAVVELAAHEWVQLAARWKT
jgi:hypothetical protein